MPFYAYQTVPCCCRRRGQDGVVTVGIPPGGASGRTTGNGTLEYFTYKEVPKMSFGEGRVSHEPTKIHPQRFLIKSETIARKTRRKQVERWVGLKIGPTSS